MSNIIFKRGLDLNNDTPAVQDGQILFDSYGKIAWDMLVNDEITRIDCYPDNAAHAISAEEADYAYDAGHAVSADNATLATTATTATIANKVNVSNSISADDSPGYNYITFDNNGVFSHDARLSFSAGPQGILYAPKVMGDLLGNADTATQLSNNLTFSNGTLNTTYNGSSPITIDYADIGAASVSHTHLLSDISNITSSANEINYLVGTTSNIQAQLNNKAASNHTHNYAAAVTPEGPAVSALTANTAITAFYLDGISKANVLQQKHYGTNVTTGNYFKIVLDSSIASWALSFTLRLYQATDTTDLLISGENISRAWLNPKATILGQSGNNNDVTVSFGVDSNNNMFFSVPKTGYTGLNIFGVTNSNIQIPDYNINDFFTITVESVIPVTVSHTIVAVRPWYRGESITGAVWNDYAEYRIANSLQPGCVVCENGDDTLSLSTERLQPGANIISDTFGFSIGKTEIANTPIAVSGRVLAYTYEDRSEFSAGDAVCAGPHGTVSKMTRDEIITYPDRMIGTVSAIPNYEIWGTGHVLVNNRIWIKVK